MERIHNPIVDPQGIPVGNKGGGRMEDMRGKIRGSVIGSGMVRMG